MRKFLLLATIYTLLPLLVLAGTSLETSYPAPALKFGTAVSDRVQMPAQANYNNKTQWSAGLLIYATSFPAVEFHNLIAKANAGSVGWTLDYKAAGTGDIELFQDSQAGTDLQYSSSGTPIKLNRWQFVAFSMDFTGAAGLQGHIYVSADLRAPLKEVSYSLKQDGTGSLKDDSANALCLGNDVGNLLDYEGRIALAFVSPSTILTFSEFLAWQQNPLIQPRGCQGFWFPGLNGRGRVLDYSGKANHGTITGAIPVEGVPLFVRPGTRPARTAAAAAAALLNRLIMGVGR